MRKKNFLSRSARLFKQGVKKGGASLAGKILGKQSFPWLGVVAGIEPHIERYGGQVISVYPPSDGPMELARCIEQPIDPHFHNYYSFPAEGLLVFPHGMATYKGANLSHQGKLVTTFLHPIDNKGPREHDFCYLTSKHFFPKIYDSAEPTIALTYGWQGAFYHWVFEVLPRLHLVEKAGYPLERIYIETASPFQKESLALLGVDMSRLVMSQTFFALRAPQLIIPSISPFPTSWACRYLQEKILPKLAKKGSLRLYISRNDATKRWIVNEGEVMECLTKYDFTRIELSRLSFKEQAELFHNAEVIVGPHGAGFSHLVFCRPGIPILEIFSPTYIHPCYYHVADRVGLPYYYLLGEGPEFLDCDPFEHDPHIYVDIGKLEASLRLMNLA